MSRVVEVTVPSDLTEKLLSDLEPVDGLIGLRVERGISRKPAGDIVTAHVTNKAFHLLLRMLDEKGYLEGEDRSATTAEPKSVISVSHADALAEETGDVSWEEMESELLKESNMRTAGLTLMAAGGGVASIGFATGSLHTIIAATIIAPGFEPVARFAVGLIGGGGVWRSLRDTANGYAALIAGAFLTAMLIKAFDVVLLGGPGAYQSPNDLVGHWTSFRSPSILISVIAGISGAVLVESDRAVLTAGVLVALALVPSASIVGLAAAAGAWDTALLALLRWLLDVGIVAFTAIAVFGLYRRSVQRRSMDV